MLHFVSSFFCMLYSPVAKRGFESGRVEANQGRGVYRNCWEETIALCSEKNWKKWEAVRNTLKFDLASLE